MSQERGERYFELFKAWESIMSDDDYAAIVRGNKLNRAEIKKLAGVSDESLKRNAKVRGALEALENQLREKGVLPPLSAAGEAAKSGPKKYEQGEKSRAFEAQRMAQLEKENHDLRAQIKVLEERCAAAEKRLLLSQHTQDAINELGVFKQCPSQ